MKLNEKRQRLTLNMAIAWSPNLTNKDFPEDYFNWTQEDKVKLFESQVLGWQLNIADEIINDPENGHPHSGFAVLSVLLNYFEMIGGYLAGREGETNMNHFKQGLIDVFPKLKKRIDVANLLYKEARCGLYHVGLTGGSVIISRNYDGAISVVENNNLRFIVIDPHKLAKLLINHFNSYISELRENKNSLKVDDFIKRFDYLKRQKIYLQGNRDNLKILRSNTQKYRETLDSLVVSVENTSIEDHKEPFKSWFKKNEKVMDIVGKLENDKEEASKIAAFLLESQFLEYKLGEFLTKLSVLTNTDPNILTHTGDESKLEFYEMTLGALCNELSKYDSEFLLNLKKLYRDLNSLRIYFAHHLFTRIEKIDLTIKKAKEGLLLNEKVYEALYEALVYIDENTWYGKMYERKRVKAS